MPHAPLRAPLHSTDGHVARGVLDVAAGPPGHPGPTRTRRPAEEVDEGVVSKPEQCAHGHAPFSGEEPQPWRHPVIAIPPITPVVTASQGPQGMCAACGAVARAPWPAGVPSGTSGPRGQATGALCTGSYRLSKRTTQQRMDEVLRVPVRVGTISQWAPATTEMGAGPGEEAQPSVHAHAVAHREETRGRQGGKRAG